MRSGLSLLGLASACLLSTAVFAGESGIKSMGPGYRPVVAFLGGYANVNPGRDRAYIGEDDMVFSYRYRNSDQNTGFIGAFAGIEAPLPWADYLMQFGAEYNYFWDITAKGLNTVGIDPDTSTFYGFRYNYQTQQILASARFLMTTHQIYHPYASVGIGAAFNDMSNYRFATAETGSINLTPTFRNNSNAAFTYNVGAGVDVDIYRNVRLGVGYRFSGFGDGSFTHGRIHPGVTEALPSTYNLESHNAYANQFVAQLSYLFS